MSIGGCILIFAKEIGRIFQPAGNFFYNRKSYWQVQKDLMKMSIDGI
jgi:hypothetical protein